MKRRHFLQGSAALGVAAAAGALLWRPKAGGGPHDTYFSQLNELLKRDGPGHPVMLVDSQRMQHNIEQIVASVGTSKTYRVVVKSLPSVPLLKEVMRQANTNALMVFHQPFLNTIAIAFPQADVLIGKPMPVQAVRKFYKELQPGGFNPANQLQWLVDSPRRLAQYQALARELGVKMRINFEIDVGLHRGGLAQPEALTSALTTIQADAAHLEFSGLMGYEPQLTGMQAGLNDPAVRDVLGIYQGFIDSARQLKIDISKLTLNGAGSHTLRIYEKDQTMNDLSAGSAVLMPTDFDTYHLSSNLPALFIATPILKRYDSLQIPGDPWIADVLSTWDPNRRRLYYIYGGYWKAKMVSPTDVPEPLYRSTNQSPVTTSTKVDLQVDDYMFLRPTQSEHVMLQFGDLRTLSEGQLDQRWPVFNQTAAT